MKVDVKEDNGIAWVTLDDPAHRNAIDLEMAWELENAIHRLEKNSHIYALVLTGSGSAFCAGANRNDLAVANEGSLRAIYGCFLAVRDCELPTIAAVNGAAVGAGFNLAMACDIRVAAESARFESRFLQIPIHPGGGHTWMLNRLVGPQSAAALCVFDLPIDGREAARIGLVFRCVADDELLMVCQRFCNRIVNSPTPTLARMIKQTLRESSATEGFDSALNYELDRQLVSMQSQEFIERIRGRS
jgi:enoyl-CoA hydratase